MKTCTFFGHRDCPEAIKPVLKNVILNLIDRGYNDFMVGNNGQFDRLVQICLGELLAERREFCYKIVLERLPEEEEKEIENSILAEGVEFCPPRFRIDRRNEYMLQKAEAVFFNAACGNS